MASRDSFQAGERIRTADVQLGNAAVSGCKVNDGKDLTRMANSVCMPVCTESADPDLARVIEAWPTLLPPIRAAMLALVNSAAASR